MSDRDHDEPPRVWVCVFDENGAWLYHRAALRDSADDVAKGLLRDERAARAEIWSEEGGAGELIRSFSKGSP